MSDIILKGDNTSTIPAKFDVIFNQDMPNLHNWYKWAERKKIIENGEYNMLN